MFSYFYLSCLSGHIWKIAAYSAYDMFSWYSNLIVSLFLPTSGFWSENLLLIALFPDLFLLVPLNVGKCFTEEASNPVMNNQLNETGTFVQISEGTIEKQQTMTEMWRLTVTFMVIG